MFRTLIKLFQFTYDFCSLQLFGMSMKGNFDRMMRGRDREHPDRPVPPGGRPNDNDHLRSHGEDASRRQHKESERSVRILIGQS